MSLSRFIFIAAIGIAISTLFGVFVGFYAITTQAIDALIQQFSRNMAKQTFEDMY